MSFREFMQQRAVDIAVGGRYMLANWFDAKGQSREFACRTTRVSPFRMTVVVPVVGKPGDRVSTYFGDFGKLNGVIGDTLAGGFLLELAMSKAQRETLANKLAWLEKRKQDPSIRDEREKARIIPASPHSMLMLADGSARSCFVIDMSATGVAVSADIQPEIGTALAVGACVGRVVRHLPEGFAVKFTKEHDTKQLERLITRPAQQLEARRKDAREVVYVDA